VREGLSQRSGLLGLSGGRTGDSRDLVAAVEGDADAALALAVFAHRARRELAAATSLPTLDALVFTGEIGWGQPEVRRQLTDGLAILGTDHRVLVVEPHAEREIARLTAATLHSP
jgi:acetate kinase